MTLLISVLFTAGLLAAQPAMNAAGSTAPQNAEFRATTRLIQVNVVVHGRDKRPVEGLKASDFSVTQDGKPVEVAFFSVQRSDKVAAENPLPPNIFSNRFGDRAGTPESVTVVLLDALNTPVTDQNYARRQVLKYLSQLQRGERVGVYVLGRRLRVLHDFTSDMSTLAQEMEKYWGEAPVLTSGDLGPIANAPPRDHRFGDSRSSDDEVEGRTLESLNPTVRMKQGFNTDQFILERIRTTLASLKVIAQHLAAVPGRKNLVWVTAGIPFSVGFEEARGTMNMKQLYSEGRSPELNDVNTFAGDWQRALRALNNANVVVYPVDARGLMTDPNLDVSQDKKLVLWSPPNSDSMREMAHRTGGRAFYNTNDIFGSVREVFDDSAVTYTLGFYAPEENSSRNWRRLNVKVNRPDVNVRHREGYFVFDELRPSDLDSVRADLVGAISSPLDATGVALNARVDKLKADAKKLSVVTQIAPETITIRTENGRTRAHVDVAYVLTDEKGRQLTAVTDRVGIDLPHDQFVTAVAQGVVQQKMLPLDGKARTLRIVVRDAATGQIGSLTVSLAQVQAL